jgi:DNA-binding transcriptional ArsR family regulator
VKHDEELGAVLAALSDPTRRALLDVIARAGEATATVAAEQLPVSRQAVVKHLAVLGQAGIVESRRRGREVRWSVRPERLETAAEWMSAVASEWDARLAAIRRIAEGGGEEG